MLDVLCQVSRHHGIDWALSHDHDPHIGYIRAGVCDDKVLDQIEALPTSVISSASWGWVSLGSSGRTKTPNRAGGTYRRSVTCSSPPPPAGEPDGYAEVGSEFRYAISASRHFSPLLFRMQ
jgi:hypothetical protein